MSVSIVRELRELSVTIALSATDSSALSVGSAAWGSYQLPAAFTGTTVKVQYSNDGTNFTDVHDDTGSAVTPQSVTANGTYSIPNNSFKAKYIRFVSGSAEASQRTITVVVKG